MMIKYSVDRNIIQKISHRLVEAIPRHIETAIDNPAGYVLDRIAFRSYSTKIRPFVVKTMDQFNLLDQLKERNRYHIRRHSRHRDTELRNFPKLLHVELSTICNLRCKMCSYVRPGRNRQKQYIDMSLIDRLRPVLPFIKDTKLHGGGEPFLVPHVKKIIDVFGSYGVRLNTVTNGMVIDETLSKLICDTFSSLTVSIDGATSNTYEMIREGATFKKLLNTLDLLNKYRRNGFKLVLGFVIMRCNIHELPALIRIAKKYNAQEVQAAWLVPFDDLPWTLEQEPTCEPERMNQIFSETRTLGEEMDISVKLPPNLPVQKNSKKKPTHKPVYNQLHAVNSVIGHCRLMYDRAMVMVDGYIKPCGQSETVPNMGSLYEHNFEQIWNGSAYQKLRCEFNNGNLPKTCRSCNFIRSGQLGEARVLDGNVEFEFK